MHRDEVVSLPDKTTVLASTDRCAVQAFYIPGRVITVQGHPEFTASVVREILELRHSVGVFDDETFEDAVRRVEHEHDGVAIARAFLRFLRE